ncbi:hypothetical protein P3X46_008877 [Hevea brasiliensis]|uniref:NADP-dependent oxidoreductase domain-containing protein n=1 Tax=Hevea brasiliensis TaxID=3981 RepID=A0ABQ9ML70_HEVBR|nr:hypothetical protein P3X46_008877 [Hevea brasiliensis]
MAKSIKFFELNTGAKIPSVGLGTWAAAPDAFVGAITTAVKVGYRPIDCAQMYGNEKEIGFALKKVVEDGLVKREDLWITSKLWYLFYQFLGNFLNFALTWSSIRLL